MRLLVDISKKQFTVAKAAEEKLDQDGRQRKDRLTQEPLWTVQLFALDDKGGDVIMVTVAGSAPKVTVGQSVIPVELEAIPWAQGTRNGTAFRATSLTSLAAAKAA